MPPLQLLNLIAKASGQVPLPSKKGYHYLPKKDPALPPGDVVGDKIPWVRYSDPAVKEFKLNAERNNGRAAMMGITGFAVQEFVWGGPVVEQTPFFFGV